MTTNEQNQRLDEQLELGFNGAMQSRIYGTRDAGAVVVCENARSCGKRGGLAE